MIHVAIHNGAKQDRQKANKVRRFNVMYIIGRKQNSSFAQVKVQKTA